MAAALLPLPAVSCFIPAPSLCLVPRAATACHLFTRTLARAGHPGISECWPTEGPEPCLPAPLPLWVSG